MTKNGTEKCTQKPGKMETMTTSWPDERVMMGRVVSIVVAPPILIGANFPKNLTSNGAQSNVNISRMILAIRAIVPNSAPLYSVMKMLERE